MSFHTCDASCTGFQDHMVNLAESDDGLNWSLVPNFLPYSGSVPDVIVRSSKLYVYTPGQVKRYDKATGWWDTNPVPVSIVDIAGNPISYVDPSAIIDSSGNIVLFFLNSTGITGDPAGCNGNYPCTKYFESAVEVNGSDGTQFVMQGGHRASITLNNSPQSASDPDIYFDGSDYILYISQGQSVLACWSSTMHGSYQSFLIYPSNFLTNAGGIPCGNYDNASAMYWTYIHANVSGNTVIQRQTHTDFSSALANFTTVISGPLIGQPASTKTESPGFCTNDLLNGVAENRIDKSVRIFPNPLKTISSVTIRNSKFNGLSCVLRIYNAFGSEVKSIVLESGSGELERGNLSGGMYFYKVESAKELIGVGKLIID